MSLSSALRTSVSTASQAAMATASHYYEARQSLRLNPAQLTDHMLPTPKSTNSRTLTGMQLDVKA